MKRIILLILLVFTVLNSFSQTHFRGSEWKSSISQLKAKYPEVKWDIETDGDFKIYSTDDNVGGYEVTVYYYFKKNKLQIGGYRFNEYHRNKNLYYQDFLSISKILNEKYEMEPIEEEWNDTTYKNRPDRIGIALRMEKVEISEKYEDETTLIVHKISSGQFGGIEHGLIYYDMDYILSERKALKEKF